MIGKLAKFLRLFLAPMPPNLGPGELFSGVEKPTTTLAKMMAATLIEELPSPRNAPVSRAGEMRGFKYEVWKTSKFEVEIRTYTDNYSARSSSDIYRHSFTGVSFDKEEGDIITQALKNVSSLLARKALAAAEEKKQHKAIDAIASWVGVPSKEEETV